MTGIGDANRGGTSSSGREGIGVLEFVSLLWRHRRVIMAITVSAAVLSTVVAILLPNTYTGTARLLPPQHNQSAATILLGQLGGLAAVATGGTLGIKSPADLYVGMLRSRTVSDRIISRFGLQKYYDADTIAETRRQLDDNTRISAGRDGLIAIEFSDKEPVRAADVANAYIEALDELTQTLAVTEAAQRRLFFERQLQESKHDLVQAELAFKQTQERTGLFKLDDQGRAIIEAVATLRAQISAKEVELRAMRTFTTPANPEYVRVEQQLAGLREELRKLERAQGPGPTSTVMPTGAVPEAGLEYVRRLRDVRYQEAILEVIARQFEAAKIDEAREAAVLQIVDRAIPPDEPSGPRRLLIVAVSTVLGVLMALLVAILFARIEFERNVRDS